MHRCLVLVVLLFAAVSAVAQGAAQSELERIVARIDQLRDDDWDRLTILGDTAFVRILPIARQRVAAANTHGKNEKYRLLATNAVSALIACATPPRTPQVTELYRSTHLAAAQYTLLNWMARKGTPGPNRGLFENQLRISAKTWDGADLPVIGLVRIGDEKAVKVMLALLTDASANEGARRAVYIRIAATGSRAAIDAVRGIVHRSRSLPPLDRRVDLSENDMFGKRIRSSFVDRRGVKWGLARSDGLGNPDDLWLVRRTGSKWTAPVFTGVSTYWPHHQTGLPAAGFEGHDAMIKSLIDKKGWIQRFVDNPRLAKDSDGDGYSDIVEAWLGLDPRKADSDGDGLPDGIDKNPLAAPRALNDTEAALAAAFDTVTALRQMRGNVFIVYPDGVKPFELTSWAGLVLPQPTPLKPTRPDALFGFRFQLGYRSGAPVRFGSNGTTADVEIGESGGYYETAVVVSLRRFGVDWLPVDIRNVSSAVS